MSRRQVGVRGQSSGGGVSDGTRRRRTRRAAGRVATLAVVILLVTSATVAGVPLGGLDSGHAVQVRAAAEPIDACRVVSEPGRYELSGDVGGDREEMLRLPGFEGDRGLVCLVVNASDVTLEGAGFDVLAEDGEPFGVYVDGRDGRLTNVTIRNLGVEGFEAGVTAVNVSALRVGDVGVAFAETGIDVDGADGVVVGTVTVDRGGEGSTGIRLANASGVTAADVRIDSVAVGVELVGADGAELTNLSTSRYLTDAVRLVGAPGTTVRGLTAVGGRDGSTGLRVGPGSDDVVVVAPSMTGNIGGIDVEANRTVVTGGRLLGNQRYGVRLAGNATTLTDVVVDGSTAAVGVDTVAGSAVLTNVTVTGTRTGIRSASVESGSAGSAENAASATVVAGARPLDVTIRGSTIATSDRGIDASGAGGTWTVTNTVFRGNSVGAAPGGLDGDWRIRDSVFANNQVAFAPQGGDWTVENGTFLDNGVGLSPTTPEFGGGVGVVRDSRVLSNAVGVEATGYRSGQWTAENVTFEGNNVGIDAGASPVEWTVRDGSITGSETGIDARSTTGRWIVDGTRVVDNARAGISAARSTGAWQLLNAEVTDNGEVGVDATDTTGDWYVLASTVRNHSLGIRADGVAGAPRVALNDLRDNTDGDVVATGGAGSVNATRNWWGQPSGAAPGQCVGDRVDCSDPLDAPFEGVVPELRVGFEVSSATGDSGLELLFDGSAAGPDDVVTDYDWTFGDGATATGETVFHTYDAVGVYPVTYTVRDEFGRVLTEERNVTATAVFGVPIVTRLASDLGGPIVEQVDVRATYVARVASELPVDVSFVYEGRTVPATQVGPDRWSGEIRFGERRGEDGDTEVRVIAESAEGSDRAVAHVDVINFPPWIDELRRIGDTTYDEDTGSLSIGKQVPDPPIDYEAGLDVPVTGGKQKFQADVSFGIGYDFREASASPFVEGVLAGKIAGRSAEGSLGASGELIAEPVPGPEPGTVWEFRDPTASVGVKIAALDKRWTLGKIKFAPSVTVKIGPEFELTLFFVVRDDELQVTASELQPSIFAVGKLTWGKDEFSISGAVNGRTGGSFFIPSETGDPALFASIGFVGEIVVWVFTQSVSVGPLTASTDDDEAAAASLATAELRRGDWELRDPTRPGPVATLLASEGVVATEAEAAVAAMSAAGADADADAAFPFVTTASEATTAGDVTMDDVDDRSPAVAATPTGYTLVWTRPSPADVANGTTAFGDDVYTSRFDAVTGRWSVPAPLTADALSDASPAVAVAPGGDHLAAWTVIDAPLTGLDGPDAALPATEIAYATGDGTTWSAPARLTDDATPDFAPEVASTDDAALVAWQTDADLNTSTRNDHAVRYALADGAGTFGSTRTVPVAQSPAVSARDDGSFTLAYFEPDDPTVEGSNGTVVVGRVDAGGAFTVENRLNTTEFLELAVAADSVVWVDGPTNESSIHYLSGPGATPTPVALGRPTGDVRNLNLATDGGVEVLTYSGRDPNGSVESEQTYLVNRGSGWVVDRTIADSDFPVSFWQASVAGREDGFVSVFVTSVVNQTTGVSGSSDLWYATHEFRSDLAVNATVTGVDANATVGDAVAVEYVVRNVGDTDYDGGFTVTAANGGGPVDGETVTAPLPAGGSVDGTLDATLDATGDLVVRVAPTTPVAELSTANNVATLTVLRPDLTVRNVTRERVGDELHVTAALANDGPVAAEGVTYRLANGTRPLRNGTVDRLAAGAIRNVTVAVNASELDPVVTNVFRVDVAGTVDESDETDNAFAFRALQPDLVLQAAGVRYAVGTCSLPADGADANGTGLTADVAVGNRGTGDGEVTLRVESLDGATVYGTATALVPAPRRPDATAFTRVVVPLSGVAAGETVRIVADADFDRESADNGVRDTVSLEPTLDAAPVAAFTYEPTEPGVGEVVRFDATASCDPDGRIERYEWDVDGDGRADALGAVIERAFDAPGPVAVALTVIDDDGLSSDLTLPVEVTAAGGGNPFPDGVPGVGPLPPSDPDADGRYEDVNGDRRFDFFDVIDLLFALDVLESENLTVDQRAALNFDGDARNRVDFLDVIALLFEL
jgi:hypothetical protein